MCISNELIYFNGLRSTITAIGYVYQCRFDKVDKVPRGGGRCAKPET